MPNDAFRPREELAAELVDANHILADKGIFDAFGHVSVRLGEDRFLLARNLAPGQVTVGDIVEYDLDAEPVDAAAPRPYLERHIHSEIYRLRPDVAAVVHSHTPSLIPFGVVASAKLQPICHMSGFLGEGAPTFEIRSVAGEASDLLIRSRALGRALAGELGSAPLILMRGHGVTVVAPSLRLVVYRAIYAELNARLQLASAPLGAITFLTDGEAKAAAAANAGQIDRPWELWREAARLSRCKS
jgi:HCOMODA/2-hydroxy-3-carboxy-muconic semialdehyde decarboxylase